MARIKGKPTFVPQVPIGPHRSHLLPPTTSNVDVGGEVKVPSNVDIHNMKLLLAAAGVKDSAAEVLNLDSVTVEDEITKDVVKYNEQLSGLQKPILVPNDFIQQQDGLLQDNLSARHKSRPLVRAIKTVKNKTKTSAMASTFKAEDIAIIERLADIFQAPQFAEAPQSHLPPTFLAPALAAMVKDDTQYFQVTKTMAAAVARPRNAEINTSPTSDTSSTPLRRFNQALCREAYFAKDVLVRHFKDGGKGDINEKIKALGIMNPTEALAWVVALSSGDEKRVKEACSKYRGFRIKNFKQAFQFSIDNYTKIVNDMGLDHDYFEYCLSGALMLNYNKRLRLMAEKTQDGSWTRMTSCRGFSGILEENCIKLFEDSLNSSLKEDFDPSCTSGYRHGHRGPCPYINIPESAQCPITLSLQLSPVALYPPNVTDFEDMAEYRMPGVLEYTALMDKAISEFLVKNGRKDDADLWEKTFARHPLVDEVKALLEHASQHRRKTDKTNKALVKKLSEYSSIQNELMSNISYVLTGSKIDEDELLFKTPVGWGSGIKWVPAEKDKETHFTEWSRRNIGLEMEIDPRAKAEKKGKKTKRFRNVPFRGFIGIKPAYYPTQELISRYKEMMEKELKEGPLDLMEILRTEKPDSPFLTEIWKTLRGLYQWTCSSYESEQINFRTHQLQFLEVLSTFIPEFTPVWLILLNNSTIQEYILHESQRAIEIMSARRLKEFQGFVVDDVENRQLKLDESACKRWEQGLSPEDKHDFVDLDEYWRTFVKAHAKKWIYDHRETEWGHKGDLKHREKVLEYDTEALSKIKLAKIPPKSPDVQLKHAIENIPPMHVYREFPLIFEIAINDQAELDAILDKETRERSKQAMEGKIFIESILEGKKPRLMLLPERRPVIVFPEHAEFNYEDDFAEKKVMEEEPQEVARTVETQSAQLSNDLGGLLDLFAAIEQVEGKSLFDLPQRQQVSDVEAVSTAGDMTEDDSEASPTISEIGFPETPVDTVIPTNIFSKPTEDTPEPLIPQYSIPVTVPTLASPVKTRPTTDEYAPGRQLLSDVRRSARVRKRNAEEMEATSASAAQTQVRSVGQKPEKRARTTYIVNDRKNDGEEKPGNNNTKPIGKKRGGRNAKLAAAKSSSSSSSPESELTPPSFDLATPNTSTARLPYWKPKLVLPSMDTAEVQLRLAGLIPQATKIAEAEVVAAAAAEEAEKADPTYSDSTAKQATFPAADSTENEYAISQTITTAKSKADWEEPKLALDFMRRETRSKNVSNVLAEDYRVIPKNRLSIAAPKEGAWNFGDVFSEHWPRDISEVDKKVHDDSLEPVKEDMGVMRARYGFKDERVFKRVPAKRKHGENATTPAAGDTEDGAQPALKRGRLSRSAKSKSTTAKRKATTIPTQLPPKILKSPVRDRKPGRPGKRVTITTPRTGFTTSSEGVILAVATRDKDVEMTDAEEGAQDVEVEDAAETVKTTVPQQEGAMSRFAEAAANVLAPQASRVPHPAPAPNPAAPVKRGRGRPRKNPLPPAVQAALAEQTNMSTTSSKTTRVTGTGASSVAHIKPMGVQKIKGGKPAAINTSGMSTALEVPSTTSATTRRSTRSVSRAATPSTIAPSSTRNSRNPTPVPDTTTTAMTAQPPAMVRRSSGRERKMTAKGKAAAEKRGK